MRWISPLPALLLLILAIAPAAAAAPPDSDKADVTLEGEVRFTDLHRYIEAPFVVPPRTGRITVAFSTQGICSSSVRRFVSGTKNKLRPMSEPKTESRSLRLNWLPRVWIEAEESTRNRGS